MKILVVRLDHLGDLLLTTPLIRALSCDGHAVDVLVQDALKPIFANSEFVEECYGLGQVAPAFPASWWPLARWMRAAKYDAVVLAYARERRLCFASAFSGAPRRIAMWAGTWGRLTGHKCLASHILDKPRPVSEILLECSRALGAADRGLRPDFPLSDTERAQSASLLPESLRGRSLVGIHPGSAGNACNLPSAVYAELAGRLLEETDCALVITGTKSETKLLADWPAETLESERVWVSMGQLGLRQLACMVKDMQVFVCSSTGPLHIASAVGTPTVSPFCPSVPLNAAIWGNVGAPSRVVEPQTCPRAIGDPNCCDFRGQISAERLLGEVRALLAREGADE